MARKQKSILAENPAGELFIRLDYVMSTPMLAVIHGVQVFMISGSSHWWMRIERAIEWCRSEAVGRHKNVYEEKIGVMEGYLEQQRVERAASSGASGR